MRLKKVAGQNMIVFLNRGFALNTHARTHTQTHMRNFHAHCLSQCLQTHPALLCAGVLDAWRMCSGPLIWKATGKRKS